MGNPDGKAILVIGLGFGDEGKGTIVDYLVRQTGAKLVVRFNGGPQAGHNVVTSDGRHHTFAHFGSGTFVEGVRTYLSRFMLIEPYALLNEAEHLKTIGIHNPLARLIVDPECIVITPFHQAANWLREIARGDAAHGTCGMGVGEAVGDSIEHPELILRAKDLGDAEKVRSTLRDLHAHKLRQLASILAIVQTNPRAQHGLRVLHDPSWIETAVLVYMEVAQLARIARLDIGPERCTIFEGAQGVLLDENHGFAPHTTWSTTTFANAQTLLDEFHHTGPRIRIGVLRSYFTRHGPGPFPTEDSIFAQLLPEPHNRDDAWPGRFRAGPFDTVQARRSLEICGGVDAIALTHMDRIAQLPSVICRSYSENHPVLSPFSPDRFVETIESELQARISLESRGPTAADKHMRRAL